MPLHPLIKIAIENGSIIEDSWEGFGKKVIPKEAPEIQRTEMRKAYYCGFYACFGLMFDVSTQLPEEQAEKILENIQAKCEEEIKKFADWESFKNKKKT